LIVYVIICLIHVKPVFHYLHNAVTYTAKKARSSAVAETARVTIRSVMAVDQLTLTVTVNITYVNFIRTLSVKQNLRKWNSEPII